MGFIHIHPSSLSLMHLQELILATLNPSSMLNYKGAFSEIYIKPVSAFDSILPAISDVFNGGRRVEEHHAPKYV